MLTTIVIGVAVGCVYALVATGYSLMYRTTGIVNFAMGGLVMTGGMSTYWLFSSVGLPYPVAVVGGVLMSGFAGLLLWVALVLPLWRRASATFAVVLATLVAGDLMANIAEKLLGSSPETLPSWVSGRLQVAGAEISYQYIIICLLTLVMMGMVGVFLARSWLGRSMRACAADRRTSQLLGIAPERVGAAAMIITAALAGLAGAAVTPVQYASYSDGLTYGVYGFVAAVLGGFGSMPGALLGGVATGLIESLVGRYISATYEEVIALGVLLLLLFVRPQGIIGAAWEG